MLIYLRMEKPAPIALIVEDDAFQREMIADLLRNADMNVIECDSAEAGELIIAKTGLELSLLVTDVDLAGNNSGLELAKYAREHCPALKVVVVSAQEQAIPPNTRFLRKPYQPLDLLREVAL